jgi:Na+/H+-translocating membrane pyrophosphatase
MLVFLFSALAIRAVGKAAYYVINEVRRQFKENPGILKGTSKPDYGRCVDIVTVGALKEMIVPGFSPSACRSPWRDLSLSVQHRAETVAAFLMVGTIAGILMATFSTTAAARGTTRRNTSRWDITAAKDPRRTSASSATPSAIRSRIRRARACHVLINCSARSRSCWRRCLS